TRSQLLDNLAFILGGMAAEDLVLGETTTGPGSDLEQATDTARRMVSAFGMSEVIGPVVLGRFEGYGNHAREVSERQISDLTAAQVDQEVRRLITDALLRARKVLEERRQTLDRVARTLVLHETLQGATLSRMLSGEDPFAESGTGQPPSESEPRSTAGPRQSEAA